MSLHDIRNDYAHCELSEQHVSASAIAQFQLWLEEALSAGLIEPTAMTLATATPEGKPSARVVLLKGIDEEGFVFYTNYASRKGRELAANPHAALVFYWDKLERQVRVEGTITKVNRTQSETYFHSRPRSSQISAAASRQSEVITDRKTLDESVRQLASQYESQDVPLPSDWGGYRLRPTMIEFWQGRPDRLHDRLRYTRQADGSWRIERLAP